MRFFAGYRPISNTSKYPTSSCSYLGTSTKPLAGQLPQEGSNAYLNKSVAPTSGSAHDRMRCPTMPINLSMTHPIALSSLRRLQLFRSPITLVVRANLPFRPLHPLSLKIIQLTPPGYLWSNASQSWVVSTLCKQSTYYLNYGSPNLRNPLFVRVALTCHGVGRGLRTNDFVPPILEGRRNSRHEPV